jgi:hypothetical protein
VARFTGPDSGTVRIVRERRGGHYCMLPPDEKSVFFYFMGWSDGWFEGSERGGTDRFSFGTLPTLLVTKPQPSML